MKINGSGIISEGTYDNITVNGSAKFEGDIKCSSLIINGAGNGSNFIANDLSVSGALKATSISSDTINIAGSVVVNSISSKIFKCNGAVCANSIECDSFENNGALKCEDFLNAREVSLSGIGSKINSVTCNYIKVTKRSFLVLGKNNKINKLSGNSINIMYCDVNEIEGEDVIIGPHCTVKSVSYSNSLSIDKNSKVENILYK